MNSNQVEQLLQQARAASRAGDAEAAEALLQRAVEMAPGRADVWLELSGVVSDTEDKKKYLQRAYTLDPENEEVNSALDWIQNKENGFANGAGTLNPRLGAIPHISTGPAAAAATAEEEPVTYCARHPNVVTNLRCNRCGTPICPKCAIRTPVGFRCPSCVNAQRGVYYTAGVADYAVAGIVALAVATAVGYIMTMLGWFFAIFLGPLAGGLIGEVIFRVSRRRRGRQMWLLAAAALVVGAILPVIGPALLYGNLRMLFSINWLLRVNWIYIVLGVGAAIARLR